MTQDLLDLADLFLNFAGYLFTGAFGFQLRIIAEFPGDLLDLTLPMDIDTYMSMVVCV
jgi:hypothetical protein